MAIKLQHTSPELLIHPGETILEIILDRGISQKELSIRTNFTEKHISTVINGRKSISADFAMNLEYALDIPASFWRNLQTNYDLELIAFNETNNIVKEEIKIAEEIESSVEKVLGIEINKKNISDAVLKLRQHLGISNLQSISSLNSGFYRAQFTKNTSENIMYVWQYLCEKEVDGQTNKPLDKDKLKSNLENIKAVMHLEASKHVSVIQEILNDCGILFTVKKHVEKAPIKGLTVKTKKNQVMIAMTIYGKFVDMFWFTLFHEIGHVLYDDYLKDQSNLSKDSLIEQRANRFAADSLIDPIMYKEFIDKKDFSDVAIKKLSQQVGVLPTIVIGRLMYESNQWDFKNYLREKYEWVD